MKEQLKYVDDSSDKFWEIETSGNNFTVRYGRNGTSGQSQTKTFGDAEKCIREAEKLIAEKIKKGYSKDGQVTAVDRSVKISDQSDLQAVLDEYTRLIKDENPEGLLKFLNTYSKGYREELKKHIVKARKYWLTHVDLSQDNLFKKIAGIERKFGIRGNESQKDVIVLSAVALFNRQEINSWDEVIEYFNRIEEKGVLEIMEWAKPSWINSFILEKTAKNDWLSVAYRSIRIMEDKGLVDYHPELFARLITRFNPWNDARKWNHNDYIEYIINDVTAYQRDVVELFTYETGLQNQTYGSKPGESYRSISVWERIFSSLLLQGKIDRMWFIENCLLIQTKEWNANLRSFFRKRLEDIKPTQAELVLFQETLFHSLHSPLNAVVNFSISLLKKVWQEDDFHFQEFLEWVEPVMMRVDCKGGIKTLLGIFDKSLSVHPSSRARISHLTADIFVIADLSLQERAYKTLEKSGEAADTVLAEKLEMYLPQMQGSIGASITIFLGKDKEEAVEEIEHYEVVKRNYQFLREDKRIFPFHDWNEILFQFGKFISSVEIVEGEKLVNAFITQTDLFPVDAREQLGPYSQQLQRTYFLGNDKRLIGGMLVHLIEENAGIYNPSHDAYRSSRVIRIVNDVLVECQKKIKAKSGLPLLSFPTHAPHWVDPVVLVQRLIEYKKTGWEINALDFSIAISRMPRENVEAALQLCDKLDKDQASLMRFALGASNKVELKQESFLGKLFSGKKSENVKNYAIWALAARTYYPDKIFTEFEGTPLEELPNVSSPFIPEIKILSKQNAYRNFDTKEMQYFNFRELTVTLPELKWDMPDNLLYSRDIFERKENEYVYNFLTYGDVLYWHSLMPQNDQALATMILKYSCKYTDGDGESDELNAMLYLMAQPEFIFTETSLLVMVCTMFCKKIKTRSYGSEILIYLIAHRKIDVTTLGEKAGFLISENYAPLQRFTEVLIMIRDISPLHNSALILLLDSLLLNFQGKDKLPVSFKKLLELYLDLLTKARVKPSEKVLRKISLWKDYNAIKSVLRQIQGL